VNNNGNYYIRSIANISLENKTIHRWGNCRSQSWKPGN